MIYMHMHMHMYVNMCMYWIEYQTILYTLSLNDRHHRMGSTIMGKFGCLSLLPGDAARSVAVVGAKSDLMRRRCNSRTTVRELGGRTSVEKLSNR